MDVLLAELTNSGSWADPVAWGNLVERIGVGGFFFVFVTLVSAFFAWQWGGIIVKSLFGEKGVIERSYVSLSSFLEATKANQEKISSLFDAHVGNCEKIHEPMGPCNVKDMRLAGHSAAEALREMARGTPNEKAVAEHADDMRAILRGERP
jgi:hypothetical protein